MKVVSKWATAPLGDVVEETQYGTSLKANDQGAGVPVLRMNNITYSGALDLTVIKHVEMPGEDFEQYSVRRGDLLFNRTNSQELVGKMGVWNRDEQVAFAGYLIRLRVKPDRADSAFVGAWFNTPEMKALLRTRAKPSINMSNINATEVLKFPVVLPPLAEQRRIAEVLERAEVLRAKRRAALAQLDSLTESIFLDLFGDPARNTKKLQTISLGALGEWSSGGTPPRSRDDYFTGSIPWFSSGELDDMFVVESQEHISAAALRETTAKAVPMGALMLGMYDTAALKASIAGIECSCNQAIAYASINPALAETIFVYFAIVIGREHFRRLQRGVRQKNLNLSMIREISIPRPELQLQCEFVRLVTAVEKLKKAQRASLVELDALFASIQHRAFSGSL